MELNWRNHIHSDTKILLGKPVIKHSRISVELLLELFASGWTHQQILESYPKLTKEDLLAVFYYLKDCLAQELYFPVKNPI